MKTKAMPNTQDPFNLARFVYAQWHEQACLEIREGRKKTHWMWFTFPQIAGLGTEAIEFEISGRREAEAYLDHEILGPRLRECSLLVSLLPKQPITDVFPDRDIRKLRSSMTLFAQVTLDNKVFMDVLTKFYGGRLDQLTLDRL